MIQRIKILITYSRWSDLVRSALLHLGIQKATVADENAPDSVLGLLEVVLDTHDILVSAELQEDSLPSILARGRRSTSWRQEHLQRLFVPLTEVLNCCPDKWIVLSGKELPGVRPASQVHLLCVDLVWNIDQQYVEVVVGVVVWLEDDLDLVSCLGLDGALRGNEKERPLLREVVYSSHLGYQLEVDREAAHVCDLEDLFDSLIHE